MSILVVGASGFIGKNLLLEMPRKWNVYGVYRSSPDFLSFLEKNELTNVQPLKCDLGNLKEVEVVMAGLKEIDVCVYLVANTSVGRLIEDPILDVDTNISPLLNFLRCFRGRKLIFLSSGAVYMGLKREISPKSKINPTIPYAISKYACELYIKFYQSVKKTFKEYVILRFFGAYGPYEPRRKISTKLIMLINDPEKKDFAVYGDGGNYIDFMYVTDAIRGILAVINSKKANITVDFCSGHPQTINELAMRVGQLFKKKINVIHVGVSPEYITFYASPKEMEKIFGFKPNISLENGFKMFSNWMASRES